MICYFEYYVNRVPRQAVGTHLDLVASEISLEEINPGAFATISQESTMTSIRVNIEGRPNIYVTTKAIGEFINQVQVANGRAIGPQVYLYYQPADQDVVYRARIRELAFIPDIQAGQYWKVQRHVKGEFQVIHEIWEGELTEVPLTNAYGTEYGTTWPSGIRVDNTEDISHTNEVLIHAADVDGDCQTPAMIIMRNNYNDVNEVERVFIGLNIYSAPNSFRQVQEAEDAAGTGADVVDANYSGGKYTTLTVPGGMVASTIFWNLTANDISYMAGNQFHCLLRMGPSAGTDAYDCYFYLYLANDGSAVPIWLSDPLYLPTVTSYSVEDLGVIRLPNWRVDENGFTQPMDLYMLIYSQDALAKTVKLDALHLFPVDGYRDIKLFAGLTIPYTYRLVDDQIENELYVDSGSGTGRSYTTVALGNKIMLQPRRDQKMYFIALDDSANIPGDIARTWEVEVYYRPRRLAL